MLSIVITVYNRSLIVNNAIDSALRFIGKSTSSEIICVDDSSTDGSYEHIAQNYQQSIDNGVLRLKRLEKNKGATGAKNTGALMANQPWILFLDSDDELIDSTREVVEIELSKSSKDCAVMMFRCQSEHGLPVGPTITKKNKITINEYILKGTKGECLPVVKKDIFLQHLYHEDLRGFESISYLECLCEGFSVWLSPTIARKYNTSGADRLSHSRLRAKRTPLIIKGYCRMLKTCYRKVSPLSLVWILAKIVYHSVVYLFYLIKA